MKNDVQKVSLMYQVKIMMIDAGMKAATQCEQYIFHLRFYVRVCLLTTTIEFMHPQVKGLEDLESDTQPASAINKLLMFKVVDHHGTVYRHHKSGSFKHCNQPLSLTFPSDEVYNRHGEKLKRQH